MATRMFQQFGELPLSWPEANTYLRRVAFYFDAHKIKDEAEKKAVFLTLCGPNAFDLLMTLCSPKDIEEAGVTYAVLIDLIKKHLQPTVVKHYERHIFHGLLQVQDELINTYLARLKAQAARCEFETLRDDLILSQFIFGINNDKLRRRLLAMSTLTLELAVQEALTQEQIDNALVSKSEGESISSSICTVKNEIRRTISCKFCGYKHSANRSSCPAKDKQCNRCKKVGHFQSKCVKKDTKLVNTIDENIAKSDESFTIGKIGRNDHKQLLTTKVKVHDTVDVDMLFDTGAEATILTADVCKTIGVELDAVAKNAELTNYGGGTIDVVGVCNVTLYSYVSKRSHICKCYVVESGFPVLGVKEIYALGFEPMTTVKVNAVHVDTANCNVKVHFRLKDTASYDGMRFKARQLPYSTALLVEKELQRLVRDGIIVKIEDVSQLDVITPIVAVPKKDSVRIVGDYRLTLNKLIACHHHNLPAIPDILQKLNGCQVYSVLDLKDAFLHVPLSEDSQLLTTIATHIGHFAYKRLPMGVSCAPLMFQNIMESITSDLENVVCYQDDIIIGSGGLGEHQETLQIVFHRLKMYGFVVNRVKSQLYRKSVNFLGFVISEGKLYPQRDKLAQLEKLKIG